MTLSAYDALVTYGRHKLSCLSEGNTYYSDLESWVPTEERVASPESIMAQVALLADGLAFELGNGYVEYDSDEDLPKPILEEIDVMERRIKKETEQVSSLLREYGKVIEGMIAFTRKELEDATKAGDHDAIKEVSDRLALFLEMERTAGDRLALFLEI